MNETTIKEIKSIYSGRLKPTNPLSLTPEIKTLKTAPKTNLKHTFFNGVISKLNISTSRTKV